MRIEGLKIRKAGAPSSSSMMRKALRAGKGGAWS
jgi:hypothetical protein